MKPSTLRLMDTGMTSSNRPHPPSPPTSPPALLGGESMSPGLPVPLTRPAGHGRQYALRCSCGHYTDGSNGKPLSESRALSVLARGWQEKEILGWCPECRPKAKRLVPRPYDEQPW
jgi:hypothetical protein